MPGQQVTGARQPFRVVIEHVEDRGGEVLHPVPGWTAERFQQATGNQNGNLVGLEAKIRARLFGVQPRGQFHQREKLSLFRVHRL